MFCTQNPVAVAPTCDNSPTIAMLDAELSKYINRLTSSFDFTAGERTAMLNLCMLQRFAAINTAIGQNINQPTGDLCEIAALPESSLLIKDNDAFEKYLSTQCTVIGADANGKSVYQDQGGYTYEYTVDEFQGACYTSQ
jgi:hypothetical protein